MAVRAAAEPTRVLRKDRRLSQGRMGRNYAYVEGRRKPAAQPVSTGQAFSAGRIGMTGPLPCPAEAPSSLTTGIIDLPMAYPKTRMAALSLPNVQGVGTREMRNAMSKLERPAPSRGLPLIAPAAPA